MTMPAATPSRRFTCLWLAMLVALAALIRLHGADHFIYSPDEAMHSTIAAQPDIETVLRFAHYEAHPPMLYVLLHYWMAISTDPAFVRGLSLAFGLAAIPLYYLIGRRLNGPLTGMACAALIAFSHGCIIQSYVVHHYMMMIFFISLSLYFGLVWRERRGAGLLLAYGFFAALACLTHFSAVFDVACIAAFGALTLLRRKEPGRLTGWLCVNAIVGVIALYAYRLWQPILVPLKSYFATHLAGSFANLLTHALFYPIGAPAYVLPGYGAALILLAAQACVAVAKPRLMTNLPKLQALLALNMLAYALGILLILTRLYPELGTRHSMWVLPFVILPAGWMLADLLKYVSENMVGARLAIPVAALALLGGGALTYDGDSRFSDGSEYVWTRPAWAAFDDYLSHLPPRVVILTEKDDGIMLADLYRAMNDDAFTGAHMAASVPFRNTRIVFNPYFPRNYSTGVFLAGIREAEDRHMLDGADTLVFLRMAWSRSPLTDLMLCDALEKRIVTFPDRAGTGPLTRRDIYGSFAALMMVQKDAFLRDVLAPDGKARACLNGEHDMVPGLKPH